MEEYDTEVYENEDEYKYLFDDRELEDEKDIPLKNITEQEKQELEEFVKKLEEADNTTL